MCQLDPPNTPKAALDVGRGWRERPIVWSGDTRLGPLDQGTEDRTFVVGKGESCLVDVFLKNPELTEKLGGGEGHFWRNFQAQTASRG